MTRGWFYLLLCAAAIIALSYGVGRLQRGESPESLKHSHPHSSESESGFTPNKIQLGEILWGETKTGDLIFQNTGPEPVTVEKLEASCGCTMFDQELIVGQIINPGVATVVPYHFNAGTNPGRRASTIVLKTRSGKEYQAFIEANILGTWSLDPDRIDFGEIEIAGMAELPASIMIFRSQSDKIEAVEFPQAKWLECKRAARENGVVELLLQVHPDLLPAGSSTAMGRIRTTCSVKPESVFQVRVRGVPSLSPSVGHVVLNGADPKTVRFARPKGAAAQVKSATSSDARVAVRVVDAATVEISNPSGVSLPTVVSVTISEEGGAQCSVSVSTF